jgi:oleate hydratase
MANLNERADRPRIKAYLVGGGIASLASAAYLIRDGGIPGENIHVFEEASILGGSLDDTGNPETGYSIRGGRMFTYEAYTCTLDLLSFIPSLTDAHTTVRDEMYAFNEDNVSLSHARLVRAGQKIDATEMGFSNRDRLDLLEVTAASEESLGAKRIQDVLHPSFFTTNFWYMWATTFAFQPWHSAAELRRNLHRFIQEFPRINTNAGVRRTPYNQYDSIVRPLTRWLKSHGVQFVMGAEVTDLGFTYGPGGKGVDRIQYRVAGEAKGIRVTADDIVFVTNGSMTASSSVGSMTAPALLDADHAGGGIEVDVVHRHDARSDVLRSDATVHGQRRWNGGHRDPGGLELAHVRCPGAPAAFHRAAR